MWLFKDPEERGEDMEDNKNIELKARVSRLEALVKRMDDSRGSLGGLSNDRKSYVASLAALAGTVSGIIGPKYENVSPDATDPCGHGAEAKQFIASSFWTAPTDKMNDPGSSHPSVT